MFRLTHILMGVLAAAFLFMLRPLDLGGTASFVTVDQSSFEPTLHEGELAVVRQQSNYTIGQLVAVETRQRPYFGRIVGVEDLTYQVWLGDAAQPIPVSHEYVLGRLWFNIGDFGRRVGGTVLELFNLSAEATN